MITLINPPGLKLLSGLQMHTPNPPLGLAYIAGAMKDAGFRHTVIDGTGEALDAISPHPRRADFRIQGLSFKETARRIPEKTRVIGLSCMFSTLWPLSRDLAAHIRRHFPDATLVLGGEHATAVPELVLRTSPFDIVVLGEGEETFVRLVQAISDGRQWHDLPGIAYLVGEAFHNNGLSARNRKIDDLPIPDWDSFPIEQYISR